ncbi:MAG: hypothetical protein VYC39_10795, partial [Myxococcota bacterium]|nr:hypothetical protein [Myxococcota bacterium]
MTKITITIFALILFSLGCDRFRTEAQRREIQAESNDTEIQVGVAWPFETQNDGFREGVELAQKEINSSGGIAGRLIKLHLADDKNEVEEGKKTAQVFSENIDIVAAIGH